ncbi:MAG: helix-turn-helix transcriptional regulator [Jatrophihabitans sp.]|uniref:helix-turn-helix transcriptional regulator n=1 Tax=Jatrophihabitans sp. TaxID=1932789 RepID=UPI0039121941
MDRSAVAAIAALDDDVRHALYAYIRGAGTPVTRESAAEAVGISRKLAAFHLDKLVELGVLRSGFATGTIRRVGRVPRVYEPAVADIAVHVPERTPELLAGILVEAVVGTADAQSDAHAQEAARRVARRRGAALGRRARDEARPGRLGVERATALASDVLAAEGFEPYRVGPTVRLRNCPFHPLAATAPEFVCGLNHEYVTGLVEGIGADGRLAAELAPRPGECCVAIGPGSRP